MALLRYGLWLWLWRERDVRALNSITICRRAEPTRVNQFTSRETVA